MTFEGRLGGGEALSQNKSSFSRGNHKCKQRRVGGMPGGQRTSAWRGGVGEPEDRWGPGGG